MTNNNLKKQTKEEIVATRRRALLGFTGAAAAALAGATVMNAQTTPQTTTGYALPQVAFGGGWSTSLYLANTSAQATTVVLNFFDEAGSPLSVTPAGMATNVTYSVALNPRSTEVVQLENMGDLTQGWVEAILPDGVIGYGVFRQSADGRADQEAVAPLTIETATIAQMVYDDQNFTTGISIVNPSTGGAVINIIAYNASGAQTGNATVTLDARSKKSYTLRDIPGMTGVIGTRGFLSIMTTSGTVAVLGLRFGSAAFTSIPATHK